MRIDLYCAVWAGIVAGVLATVVQVVLWLAFTDAWPEIFYRDARFAAAIAMGPAVLPPPATLDWTVVAVASLVHFALSIAYGIAIAPLINGRRWVGALLLGALFGLALFVINMWGFGTIYPWFEATRDAITAAAHIAFGVIAAGAYYLCAAAPGVPASHE